MEIPKTLIFDFFGVICTEIAPRWIQKNLPSEDAHVIHERFVKNVDLGIAPNDALFETLGSLAHKNAEKVESEWQELISIDAELVALIRVLKKSRKIGLCSNAWSSFIRPILEAHNLDSLFDAEIISSEVGVVKPNPKIFILAAEKLGISPEQCVFIDDNPVNVAAAESVGMKGVLYRSIRDLDRL